jgi:hypothetical protein
MDATHQGYGGWNSGKVTLPAILEVKFIHH